MSEDRKKRVLVEMTISAPIAEVWAALRDPEQINKWFGWDADSLKDEIDFIFLSEATKADEATHTIAFGEWEGIADSFELEAKGNATVLRVVRAGPAAALTWDEIYNEIAEGWITFVHQLRFWLNGTRAKPAGRFFSPAKRQLPTKLRCLRCSAWAESGTARSAALIPPRCWDRLSAASSIIAPHSRPASRSSNGGTGWWWSPKGRKAKARRTAAAAWC